MEAHEGILMCIWELAFNGFLVHILRNGVVDIKEGYDIITDTGSDVLRQCTVNIYFAGYRNSATGQTAVYVAWYETELGLECRPALAGDGNILTISSVLFYQIQKGQLILSQLLKNFRLLVAGTKLSFHILNNVRNTLIACMLVECFEQIQLGVLFNLNT